MKLRPNMVHLASRVLGTPLAIRPAAAQAVMAAIGWRIGLGAPPAAESSSGDPVKRSSLDVSPDGIATIQVRGELVRRAGGVEALSGLTSYDEVSAEFDEAAGDARVSGILLDLDSPGGEVSGMFELAEKIASCSKPVFACSNDSAYSAAYALASASDRIYVTRTGGVGSIGIVALHVDQSGADKADGLAYTFVHAGAQKVDGNPHEPLSVRAHDTIQGRVDALHDMFVKAVAGNRNLTQTAVRATEAKTYMGEEGVVAGLADKVGTLEDARQGLRAEIKRRASVDLSTKMKALLVLPEAAGEAEIVTAVEKSLALTGKSELDASAARSELATVRGELVKTIAGLESARVDHRVELAKVKAIEGGLDPLPKDVEDAARALFAAKHDVLGAQTLDRHLEACKARRLALKDPSAKLQKDESSGAKAERRTAEDEAFAKITGKAGKKKVS